MLTYLLAEFETAWRHLGGLEEKRLRLFLGYCAFSTLNIVGGLALVTHANPADSALALAVGLIPAVWLTLVSLAFRYVALSERKATERYRNKINLLRKTLLSGLSSGRLLEMQREGNDFGLQIQTTVSKALDLQDLLDKNLWTTALFMKVVYDFGTLVGLVMSAVTISSALHYGVSVY